MFFEFFAKQLQVEKLNEIIYCETKRYAKPDAITLGRNICSRFG
jgi:hypothetical protein